MMHVRAAITGVNGWVPEDILTNRELENMVDTTEEWITSRTGIRERRILKGKDQLLFENVGSMIFFDAHFLLENVETCI